MTATMDCYEHNLNFTMYEYPGEAAYLKTLETVDYVKIVFIALVMAGSLTGNASVIAVVALTKSMRTTPINIYVANLGVADLLVCAICMTSFLGKTIQTNHVYILGAVMCKAVHFGQMTFLTSSVLTLAAISADRFCAVLFPLRTRVKKHRTSLVIVIVWIVSIAVSLPLLFVRKQYVLEWWDFKQFTCGDEWPKTYNEEKHMCEPITWMPRFYYTFLSVTLFFLPAAIMTVMYSFILREIPSVPPGETNESITSARSRNKKKMTKMVFAVLIVFVICWMPLQIVLLYDKNRLDRKALPTWFEEATRAAEFLAYTNSFFNPIIYAGFNKTFRDNLCLLLRCKRPGGRRFGTQQGVMQRFKQTLTTALSTTLTTNEAHGYEESADDDGKAAATKRKKITIRHRNPEGNEPEGETSKKRNTTSV